GDKVQWVMRGGLPRAAVIRTWRRKDGDDESELQELSVFAIYRGKACAYGTVDIHKPQANEAALALANEAAESRCSKKETGRGQTTGLRSRSQQKWIFTSCCA